MDDGRTAASGEHNPFDSGHSDDGVTVQPGNLFKKLLSQPTVQNHRLGWTLFFACGNAVSNSISYLASLLGSPKALGWTKEPLSLTSSDETLKGSAIGLHLFCILMIYSYYKLMDRRTYNQLINLNPDQADTSILMSSSTRDHGNFCNNPSAWIFACVKPWETYLLGDRHTLDVSHQRMPEQSMGMKLATFGNALFKSYGNIVTLLLFLQPWFTLGGAIASTSLAFFGSFFVMYMLGENIEEMKKEANILQKAAAAFTTSFFIAGTTATYFLNILAAPSKFDSTLHSAKELKDPWDYVQMIVYGGLSLASMYSSWMIFYPKIVNQLIALSSKDLEFNTRDVLQAFPGALMRGVATGLSLMIFSRDYLKFDVPASWVVGAFSFVFNTYIPLSLLYIRKSGSSLPDSLGHRGGGGVGGRGGDSDSEPDTETGLTPPRMN